jgi:hypothetical protein
LGGSRGGGISRALLLVLPKFETSIIYKKKYMQILLREFYTKLSAEHESIKMLGLVVTTSHHCNDPSEIYMAITLNKIKILYEII